MLQLQVIQTDVLDRPLLVRRHSFPASPSDSPLNRVAPLPDPLEEDTAERSNSNSRTDGVVDSLQPNMGEKDVIRYQELSEMELTEAEKKLRWLNAGRRRGRTKFFNAQKVSRRTLSSPNQCYILMRYWLDCVCRDSDS